MDISRSLDVLRVLIFDLILTKVFIIMKSTIRDNMFFYFSKHRGQANLRSR